MTLATDMESELEKTADKLSACWLFLDAMARGEIVANEMQLRERAAAILRKQQAPGWKE